jgi:NAD(P)-dependent dehydrogenase (short-subunit alcohol dehydrogenase family)
MGDKAEAREETRPVAVVTGAARGIGRAIVIELARHGFDIAAIDVAWGDERSSECARSLEQEIAAHDAKLFPLAGDIEELPAHSELIDSITGSMGRIDLLVNNAGVAPLDRRDVLDMTPQSFDHVLGINLRGTFFFTQRVVQKMIGARAVHSDRPMAVIFITSISAEVSSVNRAEYCISKSGLSMAAKVFADRLAPEGIAVYEIRPGIILTAMTEPVKEKYDRLIAEGLVPQGRWGHPEDVAKAVAALACGALDYSTGAVIEVSGGMNVRRL